MNDVMRVEHGASLGTVAKPRRRTCLALRVRLRWNLDLSGNAKSLDDKLVNFQSPDSGATNGQSADGYSTNGQRAECDCAQRQRADRLRLGVHSPGFA